MINELNKDNTDNLTHSLLLILSFFNIKNLSSFSFIILLVGLKVITILVHSLKNLLILYLILPLTGSKIYTSSFLIFLIITKCEYTLLTLI